MPGVSHGGDDDDFAARIRAELPGLLAFACALTRHAADAEDLVQEACLSACEDWHAFDSSRSLAAWLRGILRHKHIDGLRRRRETPLDEATLDAIEAIHADIDNRPGQVDRLEALAACLARLPPGQRQLIEDHHQHGKAVTRIAVDLGVEIDAVKKRLQRARAVLLACLRGHGFVVTDRSARTNGDQHES